MSITIIVSSCDGYRERKDYKTLKGAQKAAQAHVGKAPTFGRTYAVSDDGIGKVEVVAGTTLAELFPATRKTSEPIVKDADYYANKYGWGS